MSKNTRNRIVLTAVAALLLVTLTIGGTLAWMTADSDPVTNEFTTSAIDVTLAETKGSDTDGDTYREFKMIPGATIEKDPKVTAVNTDVDAYLFVKITESDNLDTYLSYVVADGWTYVDGFTATSNPTVIYREVKKDDATKTFSIIATVNEDGTKTNDTVKVNATVNGTLMTEAQTNVPTLSFQAYIIQKDNLTTTDSADIWALAQTNGSYATVDDIP